jgi:magnesium-protoporphyrin O-methyltransferase
MTFSAFVLFTVVAVGNVAAFSPKVTTFRVSTPLQSTIDDKVEVEEYFNGEGFNRWNKIYSESDEVNSVQLNIRDGHQQTIDKVLKWVTNEDNSKNTLCDAGCGVGSLALPASQGFKKVFASDISKAMTDEAKARSKQMGMKNIDFKVSDMESLKGKYSTVSCIDVFIHYPTDKMYGIVDHLCSLAEDRVIVSFAPKNFFYDTLKKIGEFFPGPSKTTRAYLHPEEDVRKALKMAGFEVKRTEMTSTSFYYSRLLEAVRV